MQRLPPLPDVETKILTDIRNLLVPIRATASLAPGSIGEGISLLLTLRQEIYEDLNQIQHEHLILRGAEWLRANGHDEPEKQWFWNPRQTGGKKEPDLAVFLGGQQIVSAEVTASENPQGTIDEHMTSTLEKLSGMPGHQLYFVRTKSMRTRAETKIKKAAYLRTLPSAWSFSNTCLRVWRPARQSACTRIVHDRSPTIQDWLDRL
jgi:hypothetical protein